MKVIGVIPARYASTRFPGKPLALIHDKPMIQWVYEAASKSELLDMVYIATDDERIYEAAGTFDANVMMTSLDHESGSDRVAEVAEKTDGDIYVNIQGDEPLLDASCIDSAVKPLLKDKDILMSTLKTDLESIDELFNINIVKVVTDNKDFALYFSRLPIPFCRDKGYNYQNFPEKFSHNKERLSYYFAQIGLYVFRKDFLLKFTRIAPSKLEQIERLEQLRALENGYKIKVIYTDKPSIGVDSPEDLGKIIEIMKKRES